MKCNIIKTMGLALAVCGVGVSCTDPFGSMNSDPMGITSGNPDYMMPYIQEQGARIASWEYQVGDNLHTNLYAQYFANSAAYFSSDSYSYKSNWVTDGFWNSYYVGVLKQFKKAKEITEARPEYGNILQTMRIFTARCTAQTTDIFGDIPYTEGAEGSSQAKYDSQQSIYTAIFKELTEAVDSLNANLTNASMVTYKANQDLIFDGDLGKWIKLANSLRLRYALRLAYIDPETAKKEGEAALAATGGLMSSNQDNAGVYISGTGANGWPLFQISGWGEFCMSKTMENMLKQTSSVQDPRTALWFGHTETSTAAAPKFAGIPNGLASEDIATYPDKSYVWGLQTLPAWNSKDDKTTSFNVAKRQKVMEYAEVCFLKAEASLRGWTGAGTAEDEYLKGIQASFDAERADVASTLYSTVDDNTYKTTGSVAWSSQSTQEGHLRQIITQKWLALYPDGVEAWSEFRRTGYPSLTPVAVSLNSAINVANGEFVKKLRYTDTELRENPNAKAATLNNGKGDGMNVRVWWDTGRYK